MVFGGIPPLHGWHSVPTLLILRSIICYNRIGSEVHRFRGFVEFSLIPVRFALAFSFFGRFGQPAKALFLAQHRASGTYISAGADFWRDVAHIDASAAKRLYRSDEASRGQS